MNTHTNRSGPGVLGLLAGVAFAATAPAIAQSQHGHAAHRVLAPPQLVLAEPASETFHDSAVELCGTTKVHIDSPVRAFEDQHHVVHLTTSDPSAKSWQWTGSVADFTAQPKTAPLDCVTIMDGNANNNDVQAFDQKTFMQALYFDPSTNHVYGYGHEDYFGTRLSDPDCHDSGTTDGKPQCWYASIAMWTADTGATSATDPHIAFDKSAAPPDQIAIYPYVAYPGDAGTPTAGWIGYGSPSNIVRGHHPDGTLDGFYYMFAYTSSGFAPQAKGVCLFRSADPSDRTSWRAWNGDPDAPAYTQEMGNPFTTMNSPCAVVNPTTFNTYVRSVEWHAASGYYVAVYRDAAGVRYATSTDLLHWNASQPLLTSTSSQANYPVILDFDSATSGIGDGDDNFDQIYNGGKTYLFFRVSVASGHTRIDRQRIEVSNYP
jgi:hypothetical protein